MKTRKELIAQRDPKSPISEVFRTLRTNIQFMDTSKKMKTLLLTSTFPGEGKSWVSSNLAVTFAQAGKKVILIDADMRKGRQYTIFGVSPRPGLSNYLSEIDIERPEETDISMYLQKTEVENLLLMPAGNVPPNPSELLVSPQMTKLLEDLKESMKEKNLIRKNTVQMIRAGILQVEKDKAIELNDDQIIEIIAKEAKKRKDAQADFEKSGREDLINQNKEELSILTEYLPKQLSVEEVEEIVKEIVAETGATSIKEMGIVMKSAKEKIGAAADGKMISEVVKKILA